MHPEAQRKAQAEIDKVVGNDRFPTLADQSNLPYTDALVKEVLRWNPVAPLGKSTVFRNHGLRSHLFQKRLTPGDPTGIPHVTSTDDVYEGYFIPKGSTVFANIW